MSVNFYNTNTKRSYLRRVKLPRGKKVSPFERRIWLDQFEQGSSVSEISKVAKRAASAVRTHIAVAQHEREQGVAKAHVTRNAYEEHFKDLLAVAEQLRERSADWRAMPISAPTDVKNRLLLKALRQHVPDINLWDIWEKLQSASRESVRIQMEIKRTIMQAATSEFPEIYFDGVAASITTMIGLSPVLSDEELDSWYRVEQDDKGMSLMWGAHTLAGGVSDETRLQYVRRWHIDLLGHGSSYLSPGLISIFREELLNGAVLENDLDEEVEGLLLRRILPGRCSICPDTVPGAARPTH